MNVGTVGESREEDVSVITSCEIMCLHGKSQFNVGPRSRLRCMY